MTTRGHELQPGDVIATDTPYSEWYGQIERLEPHASFAGWQVAHFYNARPLSIEPDGRYRVKRAG